MSDKSDKKRLEKVKLGLALIFLGLILVLGGGNYLKQSASSDTFAKEPVKVEGFAENSSESEKAPQRIIIPEAKIDLEVKQAKNVNGYWEVFPDSAGWGEGSGLPGETGNQVIFAHARRGLFASLRDVRVGTRIYVIAKNNWYLYEAKEVKEVFPNQVEVIAPTSDESLTLYTCSGFADSKRFIVVAKRV